MIRLGKLQDFCLQKAVFQSATLQRTNNHFLLSLKLLLYFRGELLQQRLRSTFDYTSIDQSSEIPPYAEGCRDVIDDEVVSFSSSYTVVICARTLKHLGF